MDYMPKKRSKTATISIIAGAVIVLATVIMFMGGFDGGQSAVDTSVGPVNTDIPPIPPPAP
jgi:hypothetical protein